MVEVGIEIGGYKTRVFSTLDNGSVVTDENGAREFASVLEITKPVRTFGKSVSGDSPRNLENRHRNFLYTIKDQNSQMHLYMFLEYISNKVLKHSNASNGVNYQNGYLAIPETFGEDETRILKTLVKASSLNIKGFISQTTSVAAYSVLRRSDMPEHFIVIDFGYSKTSIGLFQFTESKSCCSDADCCENRPRGKILTPLDRKSIKIGARDFDEMIENILIKKYNLPDTKVTREKIFGVVGKIKRGLNNLEEVKATIDSDSYETINMVMTRSEFFEGVSGLVEELKAFVNESVMKNSAMKSEVRIEVVGNNFNSILIQNILEGLKYSTNLHSSESVALGACLACGVNNRNVGYRIEEILGRNVFLQQEGADSFCLFTNGDLISETSGRKSVEFEKTPNSPLNILVSDENAPVERLVIQSSPMDANDSVVVDFYIDSFMTVCVDRVYNKETNEDYPFTVESLHNGIDGESAADSGESLIERIKREDAQHKKEEEEFYLAGKTRNWNEAFLDSFDSEIEKKFPNTITSEDLKKIDEIRDAYFDSPAKGYSEEMERRKELFKQLGFVQDKLDVYENKIREEMKTLGEEMKKYVDEENLNQFKYTRGRTFTQVLNRLENYKKELKLTLSDVGKYDGGALSEIGKAFKSLVVDYENKKRKDEEEMKRKETKEKEEKAKEEMNKKETSEKDDTGNKNTNEKEEESKKSKNEPCDKKDDANIKNDSAKGESKKKSGKKN